MQQPWSPVADGFQEIGGTIAILDVGAVHHETDHQAERIDDDMTLAAFGLLARIVAPDAAAFRGFDALAIDHTGRRACLLALELARFHHETMVDA